MSAKKKLATVWLGGCSGCHMSLLDMDERILELAKLADIVKSPVVDGKDCPEVDLCLVEGAVYAEEHVHELKELRARSKVLVAFGDCAVNGNVPAMRNRVGLADVLEKAYVKSETGDNSGPIPSVGVTALLPKVGPLHEYVKVDYYIPGCPPNADLIFYVVSELLHDRVPDLVSGSKLKYG
jgi:NAD-reducing hydrogenase small subunit